MKILVAILVCSFAIRSALHVLGEPNCPAEIQKAFMNLIKHPMVLGESNRWDDDAVASVGNLIGRIVAIFFR